MAVAISRVLLLFLPKSLSLSLSSALLLLELLFWDEVVFRGSRSECCLKRAVDLGRRTLKSLKQDLQTVAVLARVQAIKLSDYLTGSPRKKWPQHPYRTAKPNQSQNIPTIYSSIERSSANAGKLPLTLLCPMQSHGGRDRP